MTTEKPRRLGRGLEALLTAKSPPPQPREASADANELQHVAVKEVSPNPTQPRKEFDPAELAELAASLKETGLLQPITVRRAPTGRGYELIAGERRLRAATQLGWSEIPALVRDVDDRTLLTLALVENLQRTDLNPIEEAEGYQRLIDDFSLTQQQVADAVGKDRSTIANTLRLLNLPAPVQRMVQEGQLTLGHARALLAVGSEGEIVELAREVVARGLTVRDVEHRARQSDTGKRKSGTRNGRASSPAGAEARSIEDQLRRRLQTDVRLALRGSNRGTLEIAFYSGDDLERILELLLGDARERT
jgi:ParB family chromosome partitioning protein